jgi:hypothetical protein
VVDDFGDAADELTALVAADPASGLNVGRPVTDLARLRRSRRCPRASGELSHPENP